MQVTINNAPASKDIESEQQRVQLRQEHQELETMLRRALNNTQNEQNRQHLQLSRQHNNRLLAYRLSLLDACSQFGLAAKGLQIQYDPITQLFHVNTEQPCAERYPLERALNQGSLPELAENTRAFLEVTRALRQLETPQPARKHSEHATQGGTLESRVA